MSKTPEQLAEAIRAAEQQLNIAMYEAARSRLRVDIDVQSQEYRELGMRYPIDIMRVETKVYAPL